MILILKTLYYFLYALQMIVFISVMLSWFPIDRNNKLIEFINSITEPVLSPIRVLIKKSIFGGRGGGMIVDFSPLIAILIISMLQRLVQSMIS